MTKRSVSSFIFTTAALLSSSSSSSEAFAPHHQYTSQDSGLHNIDFPPRLPGSSGQVSLDQLQLLEAVFQNSGSIGSSPAAVSKNCSSKSSKKISKLKVTSSLSNQAIAARPVIHKNLATHRRTVMYRPVSQHSQVVSGKGDQVSSYDSSMSSVGLTREDEIRYSFQLRTFRAAVRLRDSLVRESSGMYVHPTEAEWAAACGTTVRELRRVMHEGQESRAALVAANIGLVTSHAKKHYHATKQSVETHGGVGTILTLQDLIQEGNLGLMEAAERYQPEKGFRFSTYATWWIRQRISKSVAETSRVIRLPQHVHSMLQKVRRAKTEIQGATGKEASLQEISHFLEIPVDKLKQYTKSSQNVVSLESPLRSASFKEDSRTIGDTLASDGPTPYEDAEADYLRRDIRTVMDSALAEREREVIIQRFGLEDNKPRSVAETAVHLGITTDRVRLVEARALNKLRHPQRNYLLKEYVGSSTSSSDSDAGLKQNHDFHESSRWNTSRGGITRGINHPRRVETVLLPKRRSSSVPLSTRTGTAAIATTATIPNAFFGNHPVMEDDDFLSSTPQQQGKVWLF